MMTTEDKRVSEADAINAVKVRIAEMYSPQIGFHCEIPPHPAVKLSDLRIDDTLRESFILSEGITIDQYTAEVRVSKVKELLVYTHLSTADICQKLHYPSLDGMETELLEQTGLGIDFFQELKQQKATLANQSVTK